MGKLDIPFRSISQKLFRYICSLHQPGERFPYPLQSGQKGSLFGTVFACYVAYLLGRVQELPDQKPIVDTILSLRQSETGLFIDLDLRPEHFVNINAHSEFYVKLQTTIFCYACLDALGVNVDKKIKWLEPLLVRSELEAWLTDLDWKNPWLVSNLDMFVGIFLFQWYNMYPDEVRICDAIEAYFSWHDRHQDRATGFWGDQSDLLNAMAGAYHILIHYDFASRSIKYVEKIIDATLSLVCRDGLFVYGGGGGSCEDMDAIDILVRCSMLTQHRADDVKEVLLKAAAILATGQTCEGGFSWRVQPSLSDLLIYPFGKEFIAGRIYDFAYKSFRRSHYISEHFYSSLKLYPYAINKADTWSSWFRPLSLAFIAKRYPENFTEPCNWRFPTWPGLGFNPFLR
ncbi:MAG: hypothetical protein M0023_07245 [Desulfobacteraceae bacterium]|nr:hypothetical protein [Desulfobacteraceae bacterium]